MLIRTTRAWRTRGLFDVRHERRRATAGRGADLGWVGRAVLVSWFQEAYGVGDGHSQNQGAGQLQAIVGVELDFRQQIAERDAQEDAGREAQQHCPTVRA